MLDISNPTDVLYSSTRLTPILESSNSLYSLVIDELTANTVYDVQIRSMYQTSMLPHNVDQSAPVARTSCQTMMLPPSHVPVPIPVATKPRTGQVVVRVFRVSEILGRIRRYYLILSKTSSLVDFSVRPIAQESYWQNTFQQNWDPDSFVAAEYSQEVFSEPQMELLLSSPSYSRLKRCTGVKSTNNGSVTRHRPGRSSDLPASDPNILVYGRHLMPHQEYKAFVLACIYPNTDCSSKPRDDVFSAEQNFAQSDLPNKAGPVDGVEMIDSNARLCTSSDWSVGFSPHKLITYEDHTETGTQEPSEEPFGPVARPKIQLGGHADTFTVALTALIVGLGIVAIICIAVGCIMRQRRSKTLRNNMTISLASVDNSLKTPLANPKTANFSENNGKIEQLQTKPLATASPSQSILGVSHSNCNTPVKIRSAISITQLPEHVTMLKMNSGLEMSEEYESIEAGAGMTWIHANMEENRPKNRYANVVAYDHSRVILNEIKGVPGSDYINANYIDGYQRQKAYIATQGPLPETFYDFWRMVWEQNTHIIVMMTRLEERARVKCDQYWPTRGTETYSMPQGEQPMLDAACSYTVSIKDTQEFAYYTLRTFILKRNDLNLDTEVQAQQRQQLYRTPNPNERQRDVKEVKHFQFTAWPDYGTPDHAQPLLLFIRRVSQVRSQILHHLQQERIANGDSFNGAEHSRQHHSEMGPTIVHCSAGVGRTGAFVVIDSQLERLQHEKSIDIFGSVGRMRNQRNFMIQTEEQYTFLYDVFVEAVTVYGTEVTAHGLYNHVLKLRQTAPSNLMAHKRMMENGVQDGSMKELSMGFGQSGLDLEFKRLSENLVSSKQFSSALLPENRLKNRTADILPYEYNRVCLPVIRGLAGSDYVNANFIDGYRKKHAYIATQTPLLNTVDDFWRMMWEQGSPIIVVLGDSSTSGNIPPGSQQDAYWPTERSTRYQHLLVEPMVEYNMPHFILREFRLTDTRDGQSRTLRQFQLHGWPQDVVVPRSAEAIIDLIGQVHKTMAQFGQEGPITVHCNSGSGRTAVFIGLSLLLERMRCEGMVDVFLTTRMLRTQRMGMIQTTDQYAFCYAATLEYLASFDHYTSQ
ncbi:unnamed protein product [Dicrocoelium dendriticum]|nr:unnamed protein product [Dicrocoelium dendriticum]